MSSVLVDAFRYSAWATKQLIEACRSFSAEELTEPARGFGSLIATLHHIVQSDAFYVAAVGGTRTAWLSDGSEVRDLDVLEARVDETLGYWEELLSAPIDSERMLTLDEGAYQCPVSIPMVQSLHHANAHREQVRACLRDRGVQPPDVQPWEYGLSSGRARWTKGEQA